MISVPDVIFPIGLGRSGLQLPNEEIMETEVAIDGIFQIVGIEIAGPVLESCEAEVFRKELEVS